jgi:hypothetical protein
MIWLIGYMFTMGYLGMFCECQMKFGWWLLLAIAAAVFWPVLLGAALRDQTRGGAL